MINIEKTREYYSHLRNDDLCQCDYCKNYSKEIKAAYPAVAEYLEKFGVEIEKPFETMPLEPNDKGIIEYIGAQYIVKGSCKDFQPYRVGDVRMDIAMDHPSSNISDDHFILEIFPVILKWTI